LEWTLAECLLHGKNAAVEVFGPIVQLMELKPETISGLRGPEPGQKPDKPTIQLAWSQNPGCYERHLQRKYQNPLFPPASRSVTQEQIDAARVRDLHDAEVLREEFQHVLQEEMSGRKVEEMSGRKVAAASQINAIREKLEDWMERALGIGGDEGDKIKQQLDDLRRAVITDWRQGLQNDGNTEAVDALDNAERSFEENVKPFHNRFIAQMSKLESADIVPALLSEDPEIISLVLKQMGDGSDAQKQVRATAIRLLADNLQANPPIPQLQEKLRVLGVPEDMLSRLGIKEE
jgi:hypothetical protein